MSNSGLDPPYSFHYFMKASTVHAYAVIPVCRYELGNSKFWGNMIKIDRYGDAVIMIGITVSFSMQAPSFVWGFD